MLLNYKIVQLFQHTDHYSSFMTTKTMYKSYVSNLKDEPSVLVFYVNGKRVGGFYLFGVFLWLSRQSLWMYGNSMSFSKIEEMLWQCQKCYCKWRCKLMIAVSCESIVIYLFKQHFIMQYITETCGIAGIAYIIKFTLHMIMFNLFMNDQRRQLKQQLKLYCEN